MNDELAWRKQAACKGKGSLFFPPAHEGPRHRDRREHDALQICRECPVILACRAFARAHCEHGVWGGETEDQRNRHGYVAANSTHQARRPHRAAGR